MSARHELAAAITAREAAQAVSAAAQSAVDKAQTLLADAESELAKYDGLDGELARHRAGEIKADREASQIPTALANKKVAREEARESVDTARAAYDLLQIELKEANDALTQAERKVFAAAQDVLIAEAEPIARALREARETAWRCSDQLRGLAGLWLPPMSADGRPRAIAMPAHLISAFTSDARPMRAISSPDPRDEETLLWDDFFKELCRDAAASL